LQPLCFFPFFYSSNSEIYIFKGLIKEIIEPTERVVKHTNHKIHYESNDPYNL